MTYAAAKKILEDALTPDYGEGEAGSMARIVLEALFYHKRNMSSGALLDTGQETRMRAMLERLLSGEPVQYVVGHAWFYGLFFHVDRRVLIPRPETEELVHWVLETCRSSSSMRVLDVGTGSGCIAVTLKKKRPDWEVSAMDASEDAIEVALVNAGLNGCHIHPVRQDVLEEALWAQLGAFDLIVSNPPYIPPSETALMPVQVIDHEPGMALFVPEDDPLLYYRTIAHLAKRSLSPGGYLFFEANEFRAQDVALVLQGSGLTGIEVRQDLQGKSRMVAARQYAGVN